MKFHIAKATLKQTPAWLWNEKYGTAVAVCRMKADVLPTWSVKLVLELRPEEWECLPKGNGSRDGGFRGMHQSRPCQKMPPLWTGLITIVTTLAHAKCSWSHTWPLAFSSRGNSVLAKGELGLGRPAVFLHLYGGRAVCRGSRERQDTSRSKAQLLCLVAGRSTKDNRFPHLA